MNTTAKGVLVIKKSCFFVFLVLLITILSVNKAGAFEFNNSVRMELDNFIKREMKAGLIPGLSIGVIYEGRIEYIKGFGTEGKNRKKVSPASTFYIGSVSKTLTGLAIMQLIEAGKINPHEPVKKYLSWWSIGDPRKCSQITVNQLLNHTSGIPAYAGNDSGTEKEATVKARLLRKNSIKLIHNPGFEYSSLNYDILGALIEEVSGKNYADYMEEHIFSPLDMKNTCASVKKADECGITTGYRPFFGLQLPADIPYSDSSLPSGYIISTADDMCRFLLAEMGGGKYYGNSLLSPDGIKTTQTSIGNTGYGMGWCVKWDYVYHTGELANYNSYLYLMPDKKLGLVMLANTNDIGTKFIYKKSSALRRIPEGIIQGLLTGKLPKPAIITTYRIYIIIDLCAFLLVIFLIEAVGNSVIRQVKALKRLKDFTLGILWLVSGISMINGIRLWIKAEINAIFISVPDLTLAILLAASIFILGGVFKLLLLIKQIIKFKRGIKV